MIKKLKNLKKPLIMLAAISLAFLLFSQTTLGKRVLLESGIIEAVRNFFAGGPQLRACDYKDGEIILIKPIATGVGDGRYEAGDIVEIRDGQALCQRFGDRDFLGSSEKTNFLVVYYPAKLTDEQKREMTELDEKIIETTKEGEVRTEMVKRRKAGVDYTLFLSNSEILKIRQFKGLDKIPEIDLSPIIEKTPEQKSVVQVPKHLTQIESIKSSFNKIVRKIIPFVFAQTEDVKVVDPGNGSGTNYLSLNLWEAGEQASTTMIEVAKCRATNSATDTTAVTIAGWTTSATFYIKIWTDPSEPYRHNGKWDESKYYMQINNAGAITVVQDYLYLRIDGLQIRIDNPSVYAAGVGLSDSYGDGEVWVSNSIFRATNIPNWNEVRGVSLNGNENYKVWNNIAYDFVESQLHLCVGFDGPSSYTGATGYFYNNTAYNNDIGFNQGSFNGTLVAKNNIAYNNGDNYNGTFSSAGTNNLSGPSADAQMPTTGARNGVSVTFVSTSTSDFHLASNDTGAKGYGKNLSADINLSFTNDIDGQTRQATWDIGADEVGINKTQINTPITGRGPQGGLVGYWPFDGADMNATTAIDRSGNNNNGDVRNGAAKVPGISGQALKFDGVDDYVNINDNSSLNASTSFTVSAWIKRKILNSNYNEIYDSGSGRWKILIDDSDFFILYPGTGPTIYPADTLVLDTNWHHLVVVKSGDSGTNVTFYRDGVSDGTASVGSLTTPTGNKQIGSEGGSGNFFNGLIDEVRIYNRALTASEIQDLYRLGAARLKVNTPITKAGAQGGLVGNWTFNGQDISGTTAYDRSGQDKNGTISGATPAIGQIGQALSFNGSSNYVDAGNVYDGVKTIAFWVKADGTDDTTYFKGKLDEVRFYSRALSAAEVNELYKVGARTIKFGGGAIYPGLSSARPTSKILDLDGGTTYIDVTNGIITANGFTGPTYYIDGVASSQTIDNNWRFVAVTTGTGLNASAVAMGKAGIPHTPVPLP